MRVRKPYRMTGEPELLKNILSNLSLKEQAKSSRISRDFRAVQQEIFRQIIRKKFLSDYLLFPTYLGNIETRAGNDFQDQMDTLKTFGLVRSITIPLIRNYDNEDEFELENEWKNYITTTTGKRLERLLNDPTFIDNVIALVNKTNLNKTSPEFRTVKTMLASEVDTDGDILLETIQHIKDY